MLPLMHPFPHLRDEAESSRPPACSLFAAERLLAMLQSARLPARGHSAEVGLPQKSDLNTHLCQGKCLDSENTRSTR